jgi:hypothetical protein
MDFAEPLTIAPIRTPILAVDVDIVLCDRTPLAEWHGRARP